ncbi:hypothetical protein PsorP6_007618 [Peronosclerospora sorghi]|uniref:Uncharacterized protein n=1 Tax=Peronosclerospora sorghi TaxID=230839 RepID=A0ACC0WBS4_9STRA|nr:hypothetical protein PsorP6_007618 [Peronosclerospora sorghi]
MSREDVMAQLALAREENDLLLNEHQTLRPELHACRCLGGHVSRFAPIRFATAGQTKKKLRQTTGHIEGLNVELWRITALNKQMTSDLSTVTAELKVLVEENSELKQTLETTRHQLADARQKKYT